MSAAGPASRGASYLLVRRVFLSLVGGVFAIAFASLWVQAEGLFGSTGILPACEFLDLAGEQLGGGERVWRVPSLFWLHCSDAALHAALALGMGLSLLLVLGVAPAAVSALLWLLYLSLSSVAGVFLGYQWDVLLVEVAFLAIFVAPRQLRPRDAWRSRAPRSVLWLLRWLLFRLLFLSGMVKLLSGDPTWRELTALEYHYFTQPIPAWTSWLAHQLPAPLQKLSAGAMFAIELALPFLALGPRRARWVAAGGIALLQLLIAATGNYGFFNLLTLVLCVTLFDDAALRRATPARWRARLPDVSEADLPQPHPASRAAYAALFACALFFTGAAGLARMGLSPDWSAPVASLLESARGLRTFNGYGLFAVMTTQRPEILLEGSADGETWQPYEFRWKPGRLDRAPRFAQPHMPRLDWQMWFAALRSCSPWFQRFLLRLLEGSPEVGALLANDPFAAEPPRYLRSTVHLYRFAPPGSDAWWESEPLRAYCPTVRLRGGELVPAHLGAGALR